MLGRRVAVILALLGPAGCMDCENAIAGFDPTLDTIRWIDERTIELIFDEPLEAPPSDLEMERFGLLRFDASLDDRGIGACNVEVCIAAIDGRTPSATEWDPERPERLRLVYTDSIPGACGAGGREPIAAQGFELVYDADGPGGRLAYASGAFVSGWGNWWARVDDAWRCMGGVDGALEHNRFLECPDFD